jgi:2-polyprenyl-6-methoxyphenol hydroxylase-like FAD-dependent oxidoreductase
MPGFRDTTVLEKHGDFFRDFRGDTVHPSTLELFHQLGFLEDFLKLPHQQLTSIGAAFGDFSFRAADFSRVPTRAKFIALMPEWDFLDFLVTVVADGSRITGAEVGKPDRTTLRIQASLVVACDGRHSTVRQARSNGSTRIRSSHRCALVPHQPSIRRPAMRAWRFQLK